MALSLQEISERLLIQDLLVEEGASIDERDRGQFEEVYTADAVVDCSRNSGTNGNPWDVRAWVEPVLSTENFPYLPVPALLHQLRDPGGRRPGHVEPSPDHRDLGPTPGGGRQIPFSEIWFDDVPVRTERGWKIREHHEQLTWNHNFPDACEVPGQQR